MTTREAQLAFTHHHRLTHHPPGGRAAAARTRPLRRRHRAARRVARGVRAEPASACADQKHRQDRGAGGAGRTRGADPGRSRQGHGHAPHGAAFQLRHAARQGLAVRARRRRGLLRRRAGGDGAGGRPLHRRGRRRAGRGGLRAAAVRRRRADREGFRADPPRALEQRHHHLQGRVRRRRRGLRQGRACVQAGAVAAPRRGAFDRGARLARRAAPGRRRHHGARLDAEGARPAADADLADGLRPEPARRRPRHRRRLRRQALRLFRGRRRGGGGEAHSTARSNGPRTAANISPTRCTSATSTGRWRSRSMPRPRCSACAASCCTTPAPSRTRTRTFPTTRPRP